VLAMFSAILLLFFLPWLDTSPVRSNTYRPLNRFLFWVFVAVAIVLGICGGKPAAEPWVRLSQVLTAYYFAHFLIIMPLVSRFEKTLPLPNSISEAVLAKYGKSGTGIASQPAE
jgi:ubiquinol-cytochrome c reductase cytochrome b subunit